eukprot:SAG22_NODE_541_length_9297_cov_9.387149_7_plen_179_part_00
MCSCYLCTKYQTCNNWTFVDYGNKSGFCNLATTVGTKKLNVSCTSGGSTTHAWPLPCRTAGASPGPAPEPEPEDIGHALELTATKVKTKTVPDSAWLAYNDCNGQGTCAAGVCTCDPEGGFSGKDCSKTAEDYGGCSITAGVELSGTPILGNVIPATADGTAVRTMHKEITGPAPPCF